MGQFDLLSNQRTPVESFDDAQMTPMKGFTPSGDSIFPEVDALLKPAVNNSPLTSVADVTSDRFPVVYPSQNNEMLYEASQGLGDRFANSVIKGLGIAATSFTGNTLGLINGIAKGVTDGKFSSFYDNELNRTLDDFNAKLENDFPFYSTKDPSSFGANDLLTSNFWLDGVVKNLGYVAGAALSGGAWNKALTTMGRAARATAAGEALSTLQATEEAVRLGESASTLSAKLASISSKFGGIENLLDKGQRFTVAALATTGEASMEALQVKKQFTDNLIQEYKSTHNGESPLGEDLRVIEETANSASNAAFYLNTALLTASNYIQFPKILGSSYKTERGILNSITRNETGEFIQAVPTSMLGRVGRRTMGILDNVFSPTEALEEGSQYAVETGVQNYFKKQYNNEDTDVFDDIVKYGANEALTQGEGIQNILIGGISGGISQLRYNIRERGILGTGGERAARTQVALEELNKSREISPFLRETASSFKRAQTLQREREQAISAGDILEAKDLERDYQHNYLVPRIKYGRYDLVQDEINNYRLLTSTAEGFAQLKEEGIIGEEETLPAFLNRLTSFEQNAANIKSLYDSLNLKYSALLTPKGERLYSDEVIDKMVYSASKVADYNQRIPQLSSNLVASGVNAPAIIDDISKGNSQSLKDAVEYIDNLDVISEDKDNLRRDLKDVIELGFRKKEYLKEYTDIKENPQGYSTTPIPEEADITQPIEGRQYSYQGGGEYKVRKKRGADFFEVTFNNKPVREFRTRDAALQERDKLTNRASKLSTVTITRTTPDGNFIVEDKDGNIEVITPAELESFAVIKTQEEILAEKREVLLQRRELAAQFFGKQKELQDEAGIPTLNQDNMAPKEPPKKALNQLAFTETNPTGDNIPSFAKRQRHFANIVDTLPNRASLRKLRFTVNQEEYLGIKGAINVINDGFQAPEKFTNVDTGVIATVVVVDEGQGVYYYVDSDGNKLNKVGEPTDVSKLVYSTLSSTNLNRKGGEPKYRTTDKAGNKVVTDEEVISFQEAWRQERERILNLPSDHIDIFTFDYSSGFPLSNTVDGKKAVYPVSESLFKTSEITKKQVLFVSNGVIDFKGEGLNVPAGHFVFKTPSTVQFAKDRLLTDREQNVIYKLILELARNVNNPQGWWNPEIMNYLRGIVFWHDGSQSGRNQIYVDKNTFDLVLGQERVLFDYDILSSPQGEKKVKDFLSLIYHHVNNRFLETKFSSPFTEITDVKDGELQLKQWTNYQEYLLSPKGRVNEQIPVTTTVRPIFKDVQNDYNFEGKYGILNGAEITYEVKKPRIEPTPEPLPTSDKLLWESPRGLKFEYTLSPEGNVIMDITSPIFEENFGKAAPIILQSPSFQALREANPEISEEAIIIQNLSSLIQSSLTKVTPSPEPTEKKGLFGRQKTVATKSAKGTAPTAEYSRVGRYGVKRMSDAEFAEFTSWVTDNLPQFPIRIAETLIDTIDGEKAWGELSDGVITVFREAKTGTGYHEAFEAVWKYFLSPEEKSDILAEQRSIKGSLTDINSTKIPFSEATDAQLKEFFADSFADYKQGKVSSSLIDKVVNFFKDIIRAFKSLFVKPSLRDILFQRINEGTFKAFEVNDSLIGREYNAVTGFTEEDSQLMVQDVTARIFSRLFATNRSLFDISNISSKDIIDSIKEEYSKEGRELGEQGFNELLQKVKIYLNTFNIKFEDEITINDEGYNRNDYLKDPFTVDAKKSSPYAVKMLLATLPQTDPSRGRNTAGLTNLRLSPIGGYMLMNQSKVFAVLYDKLSGINSISEMAERLTTLSKKDADYERLISRLKITDGYINEKLLTQDDINLLIQFYNVFSKQRPTAYTMGIEGESVYIYNSDINNLTTQTKRSWLSNLRSLFPKKDGNFIISPKEMTISNNEDRVKFLNNIGVNISYDLFDGLSNKDKGTIIKAVPTIQKRIVRTPLKSLSWDKLNINSEVSKIGEIFVRATNPQYAITSSNVENNLIQTYINGNIPSLFESDFNTSSSWEELRGKLPHLNDSFATNSLIPSFFNEEGRLRDIKVGYAQGVLPENKNGKATSKLTLANRYIQEFNHNLAGRFYTLIPADSSTEWLIDFSPFIQYTEFNNPATWGKVYDIFKGYLSDEITIAQEYSFRGNDKAVSKRAKDLRFFKDILSQSLQDKLKPIIENLEDFTSFIEENSEEINADIQEFIRETSQQIRGTLFSNKLIYSDGENLHFPNLSSTFADDPDIKLDKTKLTENQLDKVISYVNINNIIANIEMHKLIFGDPYQFDIKTKKGKEILDETKRIKSYLSPSQKTISFQAFGDKLNDIYNQGLTPNDIGYSDFGETFNTSTVTLFNGENVYGSFYKAPTTAEADAQSWLMTSMYRQSLIKSGQWNQKGEEWYQWEMAYTRNRLSDKGVYEYSSSSLRERDNKLISKPKPDYKTSVLKSIYTGPKTNKGYIDNVLDKMSQFPLVYSAIEGTNLEKLFIKMWRSNTSYVIMPSGRKQGAEEIDNLYTANGSFNEIPFNNTIPLQWKYWSIQQDTTYNEKPQTEGSQSNKIVTMDLLESGVPITFLPKEKLNTRIEKWSNLSEGDRLKNDVYKKVRNFEDVKEARVENGYNTLLDILGLTDEGDGFFIKDPAKAAKALQYELLRREMSDNAQDAISINPETGDFYVAFEATNNYIKIRDIFWSIVDKQITSPKVNGISLVQVSSTMWEKNNRQAVYKKGDKWLPVTDYNSLTEKEQQTVTLTSNDLKFYTKEEPWIEVYLPNWFLAQLKSAKIFQDNTPDEIIEYLNKTTEGREILTGIGFRIPTQGLNSIEVFKVKGFLDPSLGNTIVVPSEITTKAGSDFDIDKLNTYLKNVYIDNSGNIKLVPYFGTGEQAIQKFRDLLDLIPQGEELNFLPTQQDDLLAQGDLEDRAHKMYRQSLENEYFRAIQELVQLPENFERLTTPNSNGELEDIADMLDSITGENEGLIKGKMINKDYLTKLRHAFVMGKKWVGIGAVNITGHSVTQKALTYIDTAKRENLDYKQKLYLGDGEVYLPHNTIEVEGRGVPSFSGILDTTGKYISDKLSAYINAFVDVAKDPFILKIIKSDKVVSTFMFLERIGVPTKTIALFINQPIIREYLRNIDIDNKGSLVQSKKYINNFLESNGFTLPDRIEISANTPLINLSDNILEDNIRRYYVEDNVDIPFTEQQELIFFEFMKYAVMAEQLFDFTQAYNYDTTSFRSSDVLLKKQIRTTLNENNILSSIRDVLKSSFIGKVAENLEKATTAIAEYMIFDQEHVSSVLNSIKLPYVINKYLSQDNYQKIADKITTSLVDYLVQTEGGYNKLINTLISPQGVKKIAEAKKKFPNNKLLSDLEILSTDTGLNNIRIRTSKDVYSENLYTGFLREIAEFDEELYKTIQTTALIQGVYTSPISFTELLPIEEYASVLAPIMENITSIDLSPFRDLNLFHRNNWADDNIVPTYSPTYVVYEDYQTGNMQTWAASFEHNNTILKVSEEYDSTSTSYPLLKIKKWSKAKVVSRGSTPKTKTKDITTGQSVTPQQVKVARESGDLTPNMYFGYQKVLLPTGEPLTTKDKKGNTYFIYKQVNLYGDSYRASEYYSAPIPSQLNNNTAKLEEITDEEVIKLYQKEQPSEPVVDEQIDNLVKKGIIKKECK